MWAVRRIDGRGDAGQEVSPGESIAQHLGLEALGVFTVILVGEDAGHGEPDSRGAGRESSREGEEDSA